MTLLVTLLALGAIVALHELGHLLVARACRMRVDRYSIGFGPTLLSFRTGETEYALSLLPFGGYVKIAGMTPQDGTEPDDPRSYANRPAWQRFLVLAAGPMTNYLLAFVVHNPPRPGLLVPQNRKIRRRNSVARGRKRFWLRHQAHDSEQPALFAVGRGHCRTDRVLDRCMGQIGAGKIWRRPEISLWTGCRLTHQKSFRAAAPTGPLHVNSRPAQRRRNR